MSASTITIHLRFFAALREQLGAAEELGLPAGSNVAALRALLMARGERHAELLDPRRAVRCAVNKAMAPESTPLADGDEVAFFPPVTGG